MYLVVHELKTSLYQEITTTRSMQIVALRPHLYRHLSPAGSLQMQIWDASGNLIGSSASVNISAIGSGNYWHGDQEFTISTELKESTIYRLALVASGYTFAETAYMGWVNDFDLRKVSASYSPNAGINAALLVEAWESREIIRRVG